MHNDVFTFVLVKDTVDPETLYAAQINIVNDLIIAKISVL